MMTNKKLLEEINMQSQIDNENLREQLKEQLLQQDPNACFARETDAEIIMHLLCAALHGALTVGDVLLEVFADCVAVLVVELLFAGLGNSG